MNENEIRIWIEKVKNSKKETMDLSKNEDLAIGIANLISLEEHFYFSAMKTNDRKYLVMLSSVRKLRKELLKRIVKNPKGEEWCISKHLLAASMRLIEVGTKEMNDKNEKEAEFLFKSAFSLWSLFFGINLNIINANELDKIDEDAVAETKTFTGKLSQVMKKILDCCKE